MLYCSCCSNRDFSFSYRDTTDSWSSVAWRLMARLLRSTPSSSLLSMLSSSWPSTSTSTPANPVSSSLQGLLFCSRSVYVFYFIFSDFNILLGWSNIYKDNRSLWLRNVAFCFCWLRNLFIWVNCILIFDR